MKCAPIAIAVLAVALAAPHAALAQGTADNPGAQDMPMMQQAPAR